MAQRLLQIVLIALTLGGVAAFALQVALWPDHPLADMTHITGWVRNVQRDGLAHAYDGVYPETYLIYPPGMAYTYVAAAWLEEHAARPAWVAPQDWLRFCVKVIPIGGHLALALGIFGAVAAVGGFWRGWLAATLYAWNPAALFDVAYWGQSDSLPAALLFLAVAVLFLGPGWWPLRRDRRWRVGAQAAAIGAGAAMGALIATASLVKPQAWVFLPLVLWIAWRRTGPAGLLAAGAAAGVVAGAILLPWLRAGRMADAISVFPNLPQVMPSVSANGHNLWWLKLPGVSISVLDSEPIGGIGTWVAPPLLTFATVGRLAFGLLALLPLLRLTGPLSFRLAVTCTAYTAVAYFMTITQVHENHMFTAIPFLAAAAALDGWLALPLIVSSVCLFFNMALHDFLIGDSLAAALGARLPWHDPLALQTTNAQLNVAGAALFTALLLRRPPVRAQSPRELLGRARLILVSGVLLGGGALGVLWALVRSPALLDRAWTRMAQSALGSGPVEAKLGHHTPADQLLLRAAVDLANTLYTLVGVAAIVAAVACVAGGWLLFSAQVASWRTRRGASNVTAAAAEPEAAPASTA